MITLERVNARKQVVRPRRLAWIFTAIIFTFFSGGSVLALTPDSYDSLNGDTVWYDPDSGNCATVSFGGGSLPSSVPAPYNGIFTAAANKFNAAPALVAAIFYGGEHGNSWPQPPPPYGHGAPWATSSANAQGPFQFIPSTWASYGVDGNGDGRVDVQDLTDAAFGAAKYLAASGAKNTTDPAALQKSIFAYNHLQSYVDSVMAAYQKFSTGGSSDSVSGGSSSSTASSPSCSGISSAGCTNPFPGGWQPNRLDMGYDGTFTGHIVAPCSGTVVYASDTVPTWGGYLELKLDKQPPQLATSTLYFAEGLQPTVRSGHVNAGQSIADAVPNSVYNGIIGNIEWGVSLDGNGYVNTYAFGKCGTSEATSSVFNFVKWAQSIGVKGQPTDTSKAGCP